MEFLGLSGPRAVGFVALMLVALVLLGYVGWLLSAGRPPPPTGQIASDAPPPVVSLAPCSQAPASAPVVAAELYASHVIDLDIDAPAAGLAYQPASRTLVVASPTDEGTGLASVTLFGDSAGSSTLPIEGVDSLATGADPDQTLLVLDSGERLLHFLAPGESGIFESIAGSIDLRGAGVGTITSIDVDPEEETVVLVDADARRLLRLDLEELARSSVPIGQVVGGCDASLADIGGSEPLVLAVRPTDGHVFLVTPEGKTVHELDRDGQRVAEIGIGELVPDTVRGLAFAPSADPTDEDDVLDLYVLAEGPDGSRVHALAFTPPAAAPASVPQLTGTVITRVRTSELDPPSSDPSGIAHDAANERYIVTDSDIDELPEFAGHVVFSIEADGSWRGLGQPLDAIEVTDVAVDPENARLFFSDDREKVVIQSEAGDDEEFGTSDDVLSVIDTTAFDNFDPEGIAYGQGSLFITDGVGAHVYRLAPGADGIFSGVPPAGDDELTDFDTASVGISDPEGIAFDPQRGTLYLLSRDRREPIVEVATDGTLLTAITIDREELNSPGGLALAPAFDGSGATHLFIADRGEDNATTSMPNDGQLLEIEISSPAGSLSRFRAALRPWPIRPA